MAQKPLRVRRLTDIEGRQLQQIVRRGGGKIDCSVVRWRRSMVVLASAGGPPNDRALRGAPPKDGQSQAWRQHVLAQLEGLTKAIQAGYDFAKTRQRNEAWEAHLAPWISGGPAAVGSALTVFGATALTGSGRWVFVVVGVLFAVGGPVTAANTFVRNRNLMLRYLRLLHDIPDYAYLVLPSTQAKDAYTQLDTFRQAWETAGS